MRKNPIEFSNKWNIRILNSGNIIWKIYHQNTIFDVAMRLKLIKEKQNEQKINYINCAISYKMEYFFVVKLYIKKIL